MAGPPAGYPLDGPVPRRVGCCGDDHDDEADTRAVTVRAMLAAQWPGHADLPLEPVGATGTDHGMYRLGRHLLVRLPRTPGAARSLAREVQVLPRLGGPPRGGRPAR